jgi:hypothetical protein
MDMSINIKRPISQFKPFEKPFFLVMWVAKLTFLTTFFLTTNKKTTIITILHNVKHHI